MKRLLGIKSARIVCLGGVLTALAVILQSAPVWMPGVGLALSPLSTAPVAVAACVSPIAGIAVLVCSAAILLGIDLQEALIFVFGTGILGFVLGLLNSKRFWIRVCGAGTALSGGLMLLAYAFGINIIGPLTIMLADFLPVFSILFSLLYSAGWAALLKVLSKRLISPLHLFPDKKQRNGE
jgi:hypothetical protein